MAAGGSARLVGEAALPDGRRAVPVFQLVAERYLDPCYAPVAVAETWVFRPRQFGDWPPRSRPHRF